jgi:N-acetylglucosamine kinase
MHVLGIDAGGTKTVCLLADDEGTVVGESRGGGANLQSAGELGVEKVLYDVMEKAIGDRPIAPAAICVGIAGVDRAEEAQIVRAIMRRIGYKARVLVVNDALVALVAGAGDNPGIVVIAGTGSIAYGRNSRFEAARAGGWGHILGDEGSGYWIGREALAAAMRASDGRGPWTELVGEVTAQFGVDDAAQLPRSVYDRDDPVLAVAALGSLVEAASSRGDPVAARILERAADELALAAGSVAARLEMRGDEFPFILSGGIFRSVPSLAAELGRRLVEIAPRGETRLLAEEPAVGAVRLALAEARGGARVPQYK